MLDDCNYLNAITLMSSGLEIADVWICVKVGAIFFPMR